MLLSAPEHMDYRYKPPHPAHIYNFKYLNDTQVKKKNPQEINLNNKFFFSQYIYNITNSMYD